MALDRRVTVNIRAPDTRNEFGEHVPGEVTAYPLWAEQRGAGSVDVEEVGGVELRHSRSYTVRYFVEAARAGIDGVSIVDADGDTWNAESIIESDARRRFLVIQAVRSG